MALNKLNENNPNYEYNIAVVWATGVLKSSLSKRMSGKDFKENILGTNEVTIYVLYLNLDYDNVKINLIDIPGNFDIIN